METTNDFLPPDYEKPQGESNYLKLKDGENKFRILTSPIMGWLDWKDKKPMRFPMNAKPEKPVDPKQPIKHFWACVILDYADMKIKVFEITQGGIQTAITTLSKDKDWGNPKGYDIKIVKTGQKMDTKYQTNPVPHKPIPADIQAEFDAMTINLSALWTNGDPFAPTTGTTSTTAAASPTKLDLNQAAFDKAKERIDKGETGIIEKLQIAFNVSERQITALRAAEAVVGTPPVDDLPF